MTLGEYISALVQCLKDCEPLAYSRMCHVVGGRTARIRLDEQAVWIRMSDGSLVVDTHLPEGVIEDGSGTTDTTTVLALLRGDLEVLEAILNQSLAIDGEIEQIHRMFLAIEILLDAGPRCPHLQRITERFVAESRQFESGNLPPRANWYPFAVGDDELDLLNRYGLLPGK
ncbi:MAG TPA: hypothetical protein VMP68_32575 [Candidatus Eisenbacteria bacterium]|nr:hypothetical protein [Candidatus Eisenbacteria bacterium]